MDLLSIIGAVGGFIAVSVIGIMISGGRVIDFLNLPSVFITIGGTIAGIMISVPGTRLGLIGKIGKKVFFEEKMDAKETILTLVSFSEKARREGLLALEDDLDELEDEFLRKGIQLVVDGTDPELVRKIMENELGYMEDRHTAGKQMFDDLGTLSPAMGMIGTLIGLIIMLQNLEDKSSLGRGMSTALITTYYGALMANLYFIPFANKLRDRNTKEVLLREIMIEGVLAIQSGDNPRIVKDRLVSFLQPDQRKEVSEEAGGDRG